MRRRARLLRKKELGAAIGWIGLRALPALREPLSRTVRRIVLAAAVALSWWLGSFLVPSLDEAFWLLLPLWAAAGWALRAFPPPPLQLTGRWARIASTAAVVLFPIGLYLAMARLLGGRIDPVEVLIAVWFFAGSLEILLLYAFGAADAVARRLGEGGGRGRRIAARVGSRAVLYVLLVPFLLATFAVHRVKIPPGPPDPDLGLAYEEVSFPSRGARPLRLRGWFFPRKATRGTVIACHGVGANRGDILGHIAIIHDAGFAVLAFDFRGHGESEGHRITFGLGEREDVLGAWDYLLTRKNVDRERIYGFGVSMGAASLLQALPGLPGLRAVVADSSFADLPSMVRWQYRWLPGFPGDAMAILTDLFGRPMCGARARDVSPLRSLEEVTIPISFIHGLEDPVIPAVNSERLHEAYGGPKKLRLVTGAGHGGAAEMSTGRYARDLREFFAGEK